MLGVPIGPIKLWTDEEEKMLHLWPFYGTFPYVPLYRSVKTEHSLWLTIENFHHFQTNFFVSENLNLQSRPKSPHLWKINLPKKGATNQWNKFSYCCCFVIAIIMIQNQKLSRYAIILRRIVIHQRNLERRRRQQMKHKQAAVASSANGVTNNHYQLISLSAYQCKWGNHYQLYKT